VKPADLFDRDFEWEALTGFAQPRVVRSGLGVVSGRRRTGKSFLLRHLVDQLPGATYLQAVAEDRNAALARIGTAIAKQSGLPEGSVRPVDWVQAFELLLSRPRMVVIDEFPYLLEHSDDLLTSLQRVLDERSNDPTPPDAGGGLILCGSSLSVMGTLLSGGQALRGRASLDLRLEPFDFRQSRLFWGISDRRAAVSVDAAIGGAAGYRNLTAVAPPSNAAGFSSWVVATLLNPSHAMFREDEFLLAEDSVLPAKSMYRAALRALAAGERTPTRLGGRLGRDRTSLSHILGVLQRSGWVSRDVDLFNERNVVYNVVDPIVRFASVVIGPNRGALEDRRATEVWEQSQHAWSAQVVGPHFESMVRMWLLRYANTTTAGGSVARVGRMTLNNATDRTRVELDACGVNAAGQLLIMGEVKARADQCGVADLDRLVSIRALVPAGRGNPKLLLASLSGFTKSAKTHAAKQGIELVDLERLYEGS
jgi:uncharacterized protein